MGTLNKLSFRLFPAQIPAWIKEELAQSELNANDENEADVSDEDASNFHPDSSMTSIQVNKDLKTTSKMAPASK